MNQVQEKELGVLKEVIKVIEVNDLHYCAIGGTCLGAVRHKGFIPWDDDIDIVMPRKEYEILRRDLYKQLPEHLKKLDYDTSESDLLLFTKFHDIRTTMIEKTVIGFPDRFTGAWVDVFPLDGRPDNHFCRKIWYVYYIFLMASNTRRRYPKAKIESPRGLIKELYGSILKKFFRYNFFTDALFSFLSKYDISMTETAIWNGADRLIAKKYNYDMSFESTFFTDTISVPFENISIRIPRRYHDYLTTHFGDYMQLPPENERGKLHDICISDMEKPYSYYAKLISEGKIDLK